MPQEHVLIVEDDRGAREALAELLRGDGYAVIEAPDIARARTTLTALVDRSNHAAPLRKPDSNPSSPVPTFSTSAGVGKEVKTISTASATARGLSAQVAPFVR